MLFPVANLYVSSDFPYYLSCNYIHSSTMCLYISLVVFLSFSHLSLSSARMPEYATRVNTAYRFPIPYPAVTNTYHTLAVSSTPLSITQDWSTPSDYSLWIIQTDDYSLSNNGIQLFTALSEATMTASVFGNGSLPSSTLQTSKSTQTGMRAPTTGTTPSRFPELASGTVAMKTVSSTTSAPLSSQSTNGVRSQSSAAALPLGAMVAAVLGVAASA